MSARKFQKFRRHKESPSSELLNEDLADPFPKRFVPATFLWRNAAGVLASHSSLLVSQFRTKGPLGDIQCYGTCVSVRGPTEAMLNF